MTTGRRPVELGAALDAVAVAVAAEAGACVGCEVEGVVGPAVGVKVGWLPPQADRARTATRLTAPNVLLISVTCPMRAVRQFKAFAAQIPSRWRDSLLVYSARIW
jgi:hypothetical protein